MFSRFISLPVFLISQAIGLLFVLGLGARAIGVLDTQQEDAVVLSGQQPVEQGRARAADMEHASRARCVSNSDSHKIIEEGSIKRHRRGPEGPISAELGRRGYVALQSPTMTG